MLPESGDSTEKGASGGIKVLFKSSGESTLLLIASITWPLIDTYYIVTLFTLSLVKRKDIDESSFNKEVQWMAETMYDEGKINYFESCNQMVITGAKSQLLEKKILTKKSIFLNLSQDHQTPAGEKKLEQIIQTMSLYRNLPLSQKGTLEELSAGGNLRRKVFADFPIMAKL